MAFTVIPFEELQDLKADELRHMILNYKDDPVVQRLQKLYYTKSFLEILGINRRETIHSNFLAWILNVHETHGLSHFSIQKFLEILVRDQEAINRHPEFFNAVITDSLKITDVEISKEKTILNGRLDIYVEASIIIHGKKKTLKIIIENKVESKEHGDQTLKYYNHFNKNATDEIVLYVFLTPITSNELKNLKGISQCLSKNFIQINYQSLVKYLYESALRQEITIRTKFIIDEYIFSLSRSSLSIPSINDQSNVYNQELIMALGKEEQQILSDFCTAHLRLFQAALYSRLVDPDTDAAEKDSIENWLQKTVTKDISKYNINLGNNNVTGIKKADLGIKTVQLLKECGFLTEENWNFIKDDKTTGFFLLKKESDMTANERLYQRYRVNSPPEIEFKGDGYYVSRNWGKENAGKFTKKFSERFPGLKYEIISTS